LTNSAFQWRFTTRWHSGTEHNNSYN